MPPRTWSIREFDPQRDEVAVAKLFSSVASFDGSVGSRSDATWRAFTALPQQRGCGAWRVAVASTGVIVGALTVAFIGSKRTVVELVVNPAFRRQGIGKTLLSTSPYDRRLLASTLDSAAGAAELLFGAGFDERHRESICRRQLLSGVPEMFETTRNEARMVEDQRRDPQRAAALIRAATEESWEAEPTILAAEFLHGRSRVVYLRHNDVDVGVAVVVPLARARRSERDPAGESMVAKLAHVGLVSSMRGRGLSRRLVRAGLWAAADAGFEAIEVAVDQRQTTALTLYQREGFVAVDEHIHWMRREPDPQD
jgi:GNAT superfamily N-acetyltransferase